MTFLELKHLGFYVPYFFVFYEVVLLRIFHAINTLHKPQYGGVINER